MSYLPPLLVLFVSAVLIAVRRLYLNRTAENSKLEGADERSDRPRVDLLIGFTILFITAMTLLAMGRTPSYKYGPIRLWSGDIKSDQNSQQIADPYTFTHVIHGVGFYALLRLVPAPLSLGTRAIIALSAESTWEVFENTDAVINRYRTATLSLDYYGDSVINSVLDIIVSMLGFFFAARFPARTSILLVIFIEVTLALIIRDNLFLNIFLLIYPVPAIQNWQLRL